MYKRINLNDFGKDMQKHSTFSDDVIDFIFNYMEEEYDVENYNPIVIANKFEIISMDYVISSPQYKEVLENAFVLNLDIHILTDKQIFEMWGDVLGWKQLKMIGSDKCLFDVEYYKEINY